MSDRPLTSEQRRKCTEDCANYYQPAKALQIVLDAYDSLTAENEQLQRVAGENYDKWQKWRKQCGDSENAVDQLHKQLATRDAELATLRERMGELEESSIDRYFRVMKDAGLDAMSHEDGWTLMRKEAAEQLSTELEAVRLVCIEARELIGEADATGEIPQANINALRALLWRASIKARAALTQSKGADDAK